jgi:very-short-patch-repair endonuclease
VQDRVRHRQSTIRARELRQSQTEAEKIIWHHLKAKRFFGHKFKRQHPIGPYFPDFVCLERKLVIEIDGGQHSENKKDVVRTKFLENEGYTVIRFWNNDVLGNIDGLLSSLSLTLSRKAGEGKIAVQDDKDQDHHG